MFVASQRNYVRCHGWSTEQEINVYSMHTATTALYLLDSPLSFQFRRLGQGGELKRHAAIWHSRSMEGVYDAMFLGNY